MIRRRIFAVVLLLAAAIGSSLFWNEGEVEWLSMSANLLAATIGLIWLHYRWKRQEARVITPQKAKDIFS